MRVIKVTAVKTQELVKRTRQVAHLSVQRHVRKSDVKSVHSQRKYQKDDNIGNHTNRATITRNSAFTTKWQAHSDRSAVHQEDCTVQ